MRSTGPIDGRDFCRMTTETQSESLLEIRDLSVAFEVDEGEVQALDGVNLEVGQGQTLGLVGESGCGKSVTALSVMRLLPKPMGKVLAGSISFQGEDLLKLSPEKMRDVRGNEVGMIFQEPMASFAPAITIGNQMVEQLLQILMRLNLMHPKIMKHKIVQLQRMIISRL